MTSSFKTLDDIGDITGKRVLVREDLNVPMADGAVTDATRFRATLPTVTELADKGAIVLILAHFGRPKGKRDPEMHQTAKGKQWYFGMKAHIGVDRRTKLVHRVLAFAANVADCYALQYLPHGRERRVWGDQAYRGQRAAIRAGAPSEGLHQPTLPVGQAH